MKGKKKKNPKPNQNPTRWLLSIAASSPRSASALAYRAPGFRIFPGTGPIQSGRALSFCCGRPAPIHPPPAGSNWGGGGGGELPSGRGYLFNPQEGARAERLLPGGCSPGAVALSGAVLRSAGRGVRGPPPQLPRVCPGGCGVRPASRRGAAIGPLLPTLRKQKSIRIKSTFNSALRAFRE